MTIYIFVAINSTEFQQYGRIQSPGPIEIVAAKRMQCPNCNLRVIAPIASTYLHECIVENDWVCSACGVEWSSRFNWLLV
jgi:hypothetical protein